MVDIKETLKYSKNKSLLYVSSSESCEDDTEILSYLFENIVHVKNETEAISSYNQKVQESCHPFDILIVDQDITAKLYTNILNINPDQKILCAISNISNQKLLSILEQGVFCFVKTPFILNKITKPIHDVCKSVNEHNLSDDIRKKSSNENMLSKVKLSSMIEDKYSIVNEEVKEVKFNINELLEQISKTLSKSARDKHLDLVFEISHKIRPSFLGDHEKLSYLLLNLLNKAIKYTDSGSVCLKLRILEDLGEVNILQFEIIDTGKGIENCNDIFKKEFSQNHYILKKLTELLGGEIWVESDRFQGSTFFIKLPLKLSNPNEYRVYRMPSREYMEKSVLIIDTHIKTSSSLSFMIDYYHMPVKAVHTLDDAIEKLQSEAFDIIFIDHSMEIDKDLRSYGDNGDALVVMITTNDEEELDKSTSIKLFGIDGVLRKPFNQQLIFDTIVNLYDRPNKYKIKL